MNELLASLEDEFGIENDIPTESAATIAQEVNLIKQASESAMELAMRKEKSLQHGESIDQYMNTDHCVNTIETIEFQKEREIKLLKKNDPNYAKKVKEIE